MFGRLLLLYLVAKTIPTGIPVSKRSLAGTRPNEHTTRSQRDHRGHLQRANGWHKTVGSNFRRNCDEPDAFLRYIPACTDGDFDYLIVYLFYFIKSGTYTISVSYISRASANYN